MTFDELFLCFRDTAAVLDEDERASLFICLLVDAVAADRSMTIEELLQAVFDGHEGHPLVRDLGNLKLVVDNASEMN